MTQPQPEAETSLQERSQSSARASRRAARRRAARRRSPSAWSLPSRSASGGDDRRTPRAADRPPRRRAVAAEPAHARRARVHGRRPPERRHASSGTTSSSAPSGATGVTDLSAQDRPQAPLAVAEDRRGVDRRRGRLRLGVVRGVALAARSSASTAAPAVSRGKPFPLPGGPGPVAVSKDAVWVGIVKADAPDVLLKLDPRHGRDARERRVPLRHHVDRGEPERRLGRRSPPLAPRCACDPTDRQPVRHDRDRRRGRASDIEYRDGALWVAESRATTPSTRSTTKTRDSSRSASAAARARSRSADGRVYVTNYNSSDLYAIDARTSRPSSADPLAAGQPVRARGRRQRRRVGRQPAGQQAERGAHRSRRVITPVRRAWSARTRASGSAAARRRRTPRTARAACS